MSRIDGAIIVQEFGDRQTSTGEMTNILRPNTDCPTFEAVLSVSTTPAATVEIYASVSWHGWTLIGTLTPSGSAGCDSFTPEFPTSYQAYKAHVTAISGASANVTVVMGG